MNIVKIGLSEFESRSRRLFGIWVHNKFNFLCVLNFGNFKMNFYKYFTKSLLKLIFLIILFTLFNWDRCKINSEIDHNECEKNYRILITHMSINPSFLACYNI